MDKRISPVYRNKMEFVSGYLPDKGELLDIGCGGGLYFFMYDDKGLNYVGVDPDKNFVSEKIMLGNAEKLPFEDSSFNCVVCADVMEHVDDPVLSIKEINRVLKKGGKLILTTPNEKFPFVYDPINWIFNKAGIKIPIGLWAWGHRRLYTEENIKELVENNGFTINHYEGRSRFLVAVTVGYLPYLTTYVVSPLLKKLGFKKKGEFKNNENIEKSRVYRAYTKINNLDKKIFKKTSFINHCIVAEKIQ
ncbi:MAG: class I SAM-dependent methyltransferase [Candidatus Thorarchaeota archaeon]